MRILIIAHTSFNQIGGAERYAHQFANALANSLGRANVLFWPVWQQVPLRRIDGQAYTLVSPWWYRNRWARRLLHRYLLLRRFDLIIADMVYVGPYAQDLASFLDVPYDVMTYGIEVWENLSGQKMDALLGASRVLTVSRFTRGQLLTKGVLSERIRILPGHVDTEIFSPDAKGAEQVIQKHSLQGKKVILTICRLDDTLEQKGYGRVVQSLPLVLREVPNVAYLIVGSGPDQGLVEQIVRQNSLEDEVIFVPRVNPDSELRAYYSACDVFVMPSAVLETPRGPRGEGFGIAYIEANACGKPVIGGNSGGVPDAVVVGVTGLLVDPMNVDAIANGIVKLLQDDALAQRLGEQGLQRVRNELSLSSLQERVGAYLEDVRLWSADQPRSSWGQTIRKLLSLG